MSTRLIIVLLLLAGIIAAIWAMALDADSPEQNWMLASASACWILALAIGLALGVDA